MTRRRTTYIPTSTPSPWPPIATAVGLLALGFAALAAYMLFDLKVGA